MLKNLLSVAAFWLRACIETGGFRWLGGVGAMGADVQSFAPCCLLVGSLASCVDGEDGGFGYLWLVFLLLGCLLLLSGREWKVKVRIKANSDHRELMGVEQGRFVIFNLFHVLRRRGITQSEEKKLMAPPCSYNIKFTPEDHLFCMPESHSSELKISKHTGCRNREESTCGKILLVEDIEINWMLLRKLFRDLNLLFEVAENGQIAVDYFKQGKNYDLVLMDKEMPVMDGHEAIRQLRLLGVKAPIVALTGNSLQSDREMFFQAGANDLRTKPLSRDDLVLLLARYGLGRSPAKAQLNSQELSRS